MARKRQRDLRDFWPWYERNWSVGQEFPTANPPPFDLEEIGKGPDPLHPLVRKLIQGFTIALALLVIGAILWLALH